MTGRSSSSEQPPRDSEELFDDVPWWRARAIEALGLSGVERMAAASDGAGYPAVLQRLAHAPGEVVSREELLRVLPGESCDPHAAEVAVGRLREALGAPGVIRTVVKRGYALNPVAR